MFADLPIKRGTLMATPIDAVPSYTFEELLAGIRPENLHEDIFDGPPAGKEVW